MAAPEMTPLYSFSGCSKSALGGGPVAGHQVPSDQTAGVRQPVRETGRLRQQQQASRLRGIGGQDHRLRPLTHLAFLSIEINDAGYAAALVDRNLAHIALHADFAAARLLGDRKHGDRGTGSRAHLASVARTDSAVDARVAAHIRLGNDRERPGNGGQSEFSRRGIEQRARTLEGHGRHRIVFRHRRDER